MRIKVSLDTKDEWNDCWLETKYIGSRDETFNMWIYPTLWPSCAKNDGFFRVDHYRSNSDILINIKSWLIECRYYITQLPKEENDRITTALQKISSILKRIFLR